MGFNFNKEVTALLLKQKDTLGDLKDYIISYKAKETVITNK